VTPDTRLPVRYRAGGIPLLSVTQVLTVTQRIDPTWYTPEAAARGTAVHLLTEQIDRGEADLDPALAGYADAYQDFLATVRPSYAASELAVSDMRRGLAGRIDRVCGNLLGGPGLLDIKSGGVSAWHGLQLAGYNLLHPTGARWVLYLGANGRYKLRACEDPSDHARFAADVATALGTVWANGDYWIPR
jgi:hypothetical protein